MGWVLFRRRSSEAQTATVFGNASRTPALRRQCLSQEKGIGEALVEIKCKGKVPQLLNNYKNEFLEAWVEGKSYGHGGTLGLIIQIQRIST